MIGLVIIVYINRITVSCLAYIPATTPYYSRR